MRNKKICKSSIKDWEKLKKEEMEKSKIPLPADIDGNPDYKYMEKYMVTELNIAENALNKLTACV